MQNHLEITSKIQFWIQSVRNLTQSRYSGPIWARMGPARALEESVGPARTLEESVGPARAFEVREKFRKNAPFLVHFYEKRIVFGFQTALFDNQGLIVLTCS